MPHQLADTVRIGKMTFVIDRKLNVFFAQHFNRIFKRKNLFAGHLVENGIQRCSLAASGWPG